LFPLDRFHTPTGMSLSRSFFLAIPLLLSACAVQSEKPLSTPRYSDRDPRLEGLWRVKIEKDTLYFYIAYGPGAHGSILLFGKDKKGMGAESWDFFVTRTPKHTYLNLISRAEIEAGHVRSQKSRMYTFEEYRFSWTGQLVVSDVGGEAFSKAIEQGKLHGKVENFLVTISHTPSERILAFIETSKPKDVFRKAYTATRIGGP
jgi:hypothetical protein